MTATRAAELGGAKAALARQGGYHTVAGNLEVKEVFLDDGTMRDRFLVFRNPDEAVRDAAVRDRLLAQPEAAIAGSDDLAPAARAKLACDLRGKPTNRRFPLAPGLRDYAPAQSREIPVVILEP